MESQSFPPSQPAKLKARTLEEILAKFDSIDQVVFDPIKLEQYHDAQLFLLPIFPATFYPFDYFVLFFTHNLFETITTNTNLYAAQQKTHANFFFGENG
jgi:hypothetical protein